MSPTGASPILKSKSEAPVSEFDRRRALFRLKKEQEREAVGPSNPLSSTKPASSNPPPGVLKSGSDVGNSSSLTEISKTQISDENLKLAPVKKKKKKVKKDARDGAQHPQHPGLNDRSTAKDPTGSRAPAALPIISPKSAPSVGGNESASRASSALGKLQSPGGSKSTYRESDVQKLGRLIASPPEALATKKVAKTEDEIVIDVDIEFDKLAAIPSRRRWRLFSAGLGLSVVGGGLIAVDQFWLPIVKNVFSAFYGSVGATGIAGLVFIAFGLLLWLSICFVSANSKLKSELQEIENRNQRLQALASSLVSIERCQNSCIDIPLTGSVAGRNLRTVDRSLKSPDDMVGFFAGALSEPALRDVGLVTDLVKNADEYNLSPSMRRALEFGVMMVSANSEESGNQVHSDARLPLSVFIQFAISQIREGSRREVESNGSILPKLVTEKIEAWSYIFSEKTPTNSAPPGYVKTGSNYYQRLWRIVFKIAENGTPESVQLAKLCREYLLALRRDFARWSQGVGQMNHKAFWSFYEQMQLAMDRDEVRWGELIAIAKQ